LVLYARVQQNIFEQMAHINIVATVLVPKDVASAQGRF
jgi:hypothetical protein